MTFTCGCSNKFFDPRQIGRFRPTPTVNVILNSLGVAEEESVAWEGAAEPTASDIIPHEIDYELRAGDTVIISIYELLQQGIIFTGEYVITETGMLSIPEVGLVQAEGLTEAQLEDEIRQILSPNILREPYVTVSMLNSQQNTFTILGDGVAAPSRYVLPRYDFRLTDALATAGGTEQFNVSYIYISRLGRSKTRAKPSGLELEIMGPEFPEIELIQPEFPRTGELESLIEPGREMYDVITPMVKYKSRWPDSKVVIASTELATDKEYAQAAWPNSYPNSNYHQQTWDEVESVPKPSKQFVSPEKERESVSIKDILQTLSERNRQEQEYERRDIQGITRPTPEPSTPKRIEKPIDVDDILKSFDEPSTRVAEEPITYTDETLRSFTEPEEREAYVPDISVRAGTVRERIDDSKTGRIEWIFKDGKWIPVPVGPALEPETTEPIIEFDYEPEPIRAPRETIMPEYYEEPVQPDRTRVLKIPVDKLLAGDPKYNVIIKPGDSIFVPVDIIGEFCIMGNVNYQGYIPITGRPLTLKMAIAAAGGLGELAWPKKCEVIRRIGRDKEEIVMVDLDKIASGEQPDFFIKPNDLINVGTHPTSQWRYALRNAFGAEYGFGFVYSRNFADRDAYGSVWPF